MCQSIADTTTLMGQDNGENITNFCEAELSALLMYAKAGLFIT